MTDSAGNYALRNWSFVESYGPTPVGSRAVELREFGPNDRTLIVAAPSAVTPGHLRLPFLAAAMPEARIVSGHFRYSVVVESPSLERLWAGATTVPPSSISCWHGWANGGGGGIYLGSTPDGENPFSLPRTISMTHDWSSCRLAVLSACLTAAGTERGAISNQSLVQALLGARRRSRGCSSMERRFRGHARVLMKGFYSRLLAGMPASEASVVVLRMWRHAWSGSIRFTGLALKFLGQPNEFKREQIRRKRMSHSEHSDHKTHFRFYLVLKGEIAIYTDNNNDCLRLLAPDLPEHAYAAGPWLLRGPNS